jgi:phenylpropionate dioxygenase-like ring-hydroxylating dioxygenase large terminal subunit
MERINMPSEVLRWPANVNEVPKEVFVREDLFELEQARIFRGPEWHPVAHVSEIPNEGDFKTIALGQIPLLVVRGLDGQVRVFFNSCSHRGNQLETQNFGNKRRFECPYHRWNFDSTGALIGCPFQEEFPKEFRREDYPLARLHTDIYCGLVCVTMRDETPPLEEWLGPVKQTINDALGDESLRLLGYQKVSYKANWKAIADQDGYHAGLLHRAFNLLNWQGGGGKQVVDPVRGHIAMEGEIKLPTNMKFIKDTSLVSFSESDRFQGHTRAVGFFPLVTIVKHLDLINVRFAVACGVEDTEIHYAYFARASDDEQTVQRRARQASNLIGPCGMVSMEDASIFHRLHVGSHTPGNATFQKGVKSHGTIDYQAKQSDESGNLVRWEYYRKVMGFEREAR